MERKVLCIHMYTVYCIFYILESVRGFTHSDWP